MRYATYVLGTRVGERKMRTTSISDIRYKEYVS